MKHWLEVLSAQHLQIVLLQMKKTFQHLEIMPLNKAGINRRPLNYLLVYGLGTVYTTFISY